MISRPLYHPESDSLFLGDPHTGKVKGRAKLRTSETIEAEGL